MRFLPWRWGTSRKPVAARRRPALEALETRLAPAVFVVNTFEDTVEAVRDGSGLDANGNISLRSAVMAANDVGGAHTIVLSEGVYPLSIAPVGTNDDASGNLNVGRGVTAVELTLEGYWVDYTVIDAGYLDQGIAVGFFTTVTLNNLTITNGLGGFGGAVTNAGRVTLTGVALRNSAASHGGGLLNQGEAFLTDVIVEGNYAPQGGGVHNGGRMTVTTTTFAGNVAGQGGGLFNAGNLTLSRSTISDNATVSDIGWGGGLFNMGTMNLTNATIAQNWAGQGAGIYTVFDQPVTLTNCTIAFNVAGGPFSDGGGIFRSQGNQEIRLKNTLIAANYAVANPDISAQVISLGHNLVSVGDGGSGFAESDLVGTFDAPLDALLGALDYYGGPTKTIALLAGSLAINTGDPDGAPDLDQRGFPRDGFVDIGAFEFLEE